MRSGLRFEHAIELLAWIVSQRTASLSKLTLAMSEQVSEIEDEILGGAIKEQRVQLGRIRRFCARMRRHFAPDRSAFLKLLQRHPNQLAQPHAELIRSEIEELSFLIDEATELYERAKLLQEELASRLAEDTGRNLYVLSILSAVFLPMTLITGIFGMNVAGLPGLHSPAAFWLVMLLIVGAGVATLASIFSRNRS
jgi:zinc transporter